jgi:hypothetical protein
MSGLGASSGCNLASGNRPQEFTLDTRSARDIDDGERRDFAAADGNSAHQVSAAP